MKRKARTEMGTFSASAIDLFASALGAFIIITVVLFPYFPNLSPDPLKAIIDQLRSDKDAIEIALSDTKDKNQALTIQNSTLQTNVGTLTGQLGDLTSKVGDLSNGLSSANGALADKDKLIADLKGQLADLSGQMDGLAFIGIEPNSDHIQIVIDYSGSTQSYKRQIDSAVRLIIGRLNEQKHSLKIVSFASPNSSNQFTYWPNKSGYNQFLSKAVKDAAIGFVVSRSIDAKAGTPTLEVMEQVLRTSPPSSIFLITDGKPNRVNDDVQMQQMVRQITAVNAGRHQINVIAIGEFIQDPAASGIAAMATVNGGVLVALP